MKYDRIFPLAILFFLLFISSSVTAQPMSSSAESGSFWDKVFLPAELPAEEYSVYFSLSHGHCQLPMEARFTDVNVRREGPGMKGIKIDFDISSNSIVAAGEPNGKWTKDMKASESFDVNQYPTISFRCKDSYTLGENWFQLNGTMTIKGESIPATFRGRPIYNRAGCNKQLQKFVLDGQINLKDFGVAERNVGGPDSMQRALFINMEVKADDGC